MPRIIGNDVSLGKIAGRNEELILPRDARDKHLFVCGGTGAGKSKFLEFLIRQDIAAWRKSHCGLLLLDYHGAVYDSLMQWMAYHHLNRPVIPIDLRRDDWIVAYNVLRKRASASTDVIVENFIQAMVYVWGQENTDSMPRFSRWAGNTIRALYEKGFSLAEAVLLTDRQSVALRQTMTTGLSDAATSRDWAHANTLTPKEFENQIESTINRLNRFVKSDYLKPVFGQTEVSLDLGQAMEEGSIILVSLAREKGRVTRESVDLFATLLLNDLWTAAMERGKSNKAFYVYLDEFQHFVSPTISENLDEARKFGLNLTMACQFPGQLPDRGAHGVRLLHSVMENAATKVVFRLTDNNNLKPMAEWLFGSTLNPDQIKHQMHTTKVMGYQEVIRESKSESRSRGASRSTSRSETIGSSAGGSSSISYDPIEDGNPYATSVTEGESWNESSGSSFSEGESESESRTEGVTRTPTLVPIMGQELSHVQFRSLEEQLFLAMASLSGQEQRYCVARISDRMRAPVSLYTPTVTDFPIRKERVGAYVEQQFQKWPFFLSKSVALARLAARQELLLQGVIAGPAVGEPRTYRRRVK